MGSATAKGYPYPLGTDRVMDGDNAIQALATKVDELLPARTWVGQISVPVTASTSGTGTVTMPTGRFAVSPRCVVAVFGTTAYIAFMTATSPTSLTVGVRHYKDTVNTANIPVMIHGFQMLADNADG